MNSIFNLRGVVISIIFVLLKRADAIFYETIVIGFFGNGSEFELYLNDGTILYINKIEVFNFQPYNFLSYVIIILTFISLRNRYNVILIDFFYPVGPLIVFFASKYFKVIWLWAYLMKVIPETQHVQKIEYLYFYLSDFDVLLLIFPISL